MAETLEESLKRIALRMMRQVQDGEPAVVAIEDVAIVIMACGCASAMRKLDIGTGGVGNPSLESIVEANNERMGTDKRRDN